MSISYVLLKSTDEKYKDYKRLTSYLRRIMKCGITDNNSYLFYIRVDEWLELRKYVEDTYNINSAQDVKTFVEQIS